MTNKKLEFFREIPVTEIVEIHHIRGIRAGSQHGTNTLRSSYLFKRESGSRIEYYAVNRIEFKHLRDVREIPVKEYYTYEKGNALKAFYRRAISKDDYDVCKAKLKANKYFEVDEESLKECTGVDWGYVY